MKTLPSAKSDSPHLSMPTHPSGVDQVTSGKTSLAATYTGLPGILDVRTLETPLPGPGEILIRVEACALGRKALQSVQVDRTSWPMVPGMEVCGFVESVDSQAPQYDWSGQPLAIGSRVVWASTTACGDCYCCRRGLPERCVRSIHYGESVSQDDRLIFGGLGSHVLLKPGTQIFSVSPRIPAATVAQLPGATSIAAAALDACGTVKGSSILIIGASVTGLTLAAMARERLAASIIVTDLNSVRCAEARDFGATYGSEPAELSALVSDISGGYGIDTVIDLTGNTEIVDAILPVLRIGGTLVLLKSATQNDLKAESQTMPLSQIVSHHLTVKGVEGYQARHMAAAIEFMTENHYRYPFAAAIASWFPLQDAQAAANAAMNPRFHRVGVRPE